MSMIDRYEGAMLGLALGDALGARFEGGPPLGRAEVRAFLENPPALLAYTDDTEMALGVAESLIECGWFDERHMAGAFVRNLNPERGYGRGALECLRLIGQGVAPVEAAGRVFPGGSWGNGAAMRAAPIGLFAALDLDELDRIAIGASRITHLHPLAIEGARLVAHAVAYAVNGGPCEGLLRHLRRKVCREREYDEALAVAEGLCSSQPGDPPVEAARAFGGVTVAAVSSVPAALHAAALHGDDYEGCIGYCIMMGGDTDTTASMAGAICGAMTGGVPLPLVARLEGADKIRALGRALLVV